MNGPEVLAVVVIAGCVLAAGAVLVLGRTDADRARIRDEWRAANGDGAPRPWGSDRGSAPIPWGVVLGAVVLLGALAFAADQGDKATSGTTQQTPP